MTLATEGGQHVFEVQLYLDDLDLEAVSVKLYANGIDGAAPERVEMKRVRQLVGATNGYAYRAEMPAARPATDYTALLTPNCDGVACRWKMLASYGRGDSITRGVFATDSISLPCNSRNNRLKK